MALRSDLWFGCGTVLALASALSVAACGGEDDTTAPPPADVYEAEPFPSTHILDDAALGSLAAFDADGTLHFKGTPAALAAVAPWQVVLAGGSVAAPNGFLRVVTAVGSDDAGLVLTTRSAPIQLAFRKLHVRATRHIDDLAAPDASWDWAPKRPLGLNPGWQAKDIDFFAMNGDGDASTTDDQVHVTGGLAGGFDYDFGVDVDWGQVFELPDAVSDCLKNLFSGGGCSVLDLLPEATVDFGVHAGATATLQMQGVAFLPYEAPYTLGIAHLKPLTLGPLWFFPDVEVKAIVRGKAASAFNFTSGVDASVGLSVSFSSKLGADPLKPDVTFDVQPPTVDATLSANGYVEVGPELHLRLYTIAGPYAGVRAFADLSADQLKDPCFELHAGLTANFGFDIVTPDLPVLGRIDLANWSKAYELKNELAASGGCKPLPGGSGPSPTGGAPDAASYAKPTFLPWWRAYAGAVFTHPYGDAGATNAWLEAVPTIDGRFLIAGSTTKALLKITPSGDVVWAKRFLGPDVYDDTLTNELLPERVLSLGDATELVLLHPYTLLKMEASGAPIWAKRFDVAYRLGRMGFSSVVPASDGGFFVGGDIGEDSTKPEHVDAWLLRIDAHGNVAWSRRWGAPDQGETLRTLVAFGDGVVAAGSAWDASTATWRAWTTRFDGDGKMLWSKRYDARVCGSIYEDSSFVTSGLVTSAGDLVLAGAIKSAYSDTLVLKLKPDGTLAWTASDAASAIVDYGPEVSTISELPTGGYLLSGSLGHSENGNYSDAQTDLWIGGADGLGRLQWLRNFGGHRNEGAVVYRDDTRASTTLTKDGGAFIVGYTDSVTADERGIWTIKVAAKDGIIDFGGATDVTTGTIATQSAANCFTQNDWPVTATSFASTPHPIDVRPMNTPIQTSTH